MHIALGSIKFACSVARGKLKGNFVWLPGVWGVVEWVGESVVRLGTLSIYLRKDLSWRTSMFSWNQFGKDLWITEDWYLRLLCCFHQQSPKLPILVASGFHWTCHSAATSFGVGRWLYLAKIGKGTVEWMAECYAWSEGNVVSGLSVFVFRQTCILFLATF